MEIAILSGSLPFFEGVAGPQGTGATRKCWGPWIAQDSEGPAVWNGQFLSPRTKQHLPSRLICIAIEHHHFYS